MELANSGENEELSDENKAIIILNSLLDSFKEVKTAIKYGRTSITLEEVISALKSKDLELKNERAAPVGGENYFARGRNHQRNGSNHTRPRSSSRNRGRSSSKGPSGTRNRNCNFCGKPGHFKKQCYAWLRMNKEKQDSKTSDSAQSQDSANLSQGYDSGEVLVTSTKSTADVWILDSGCTYHMTHRKDWLTDYQKIDGGKVILGDNTTCQVEGIGRSVLRCSMG